MSEEKQEFSRGSMDKIMEQYNTFYKNVEKYRESDDFHYLYVPNVNDYYKGIKMLQESNKEYMKELNEYEKDNDDYLQSIKGKYKKIIKKQQKNLLEKSFKK